MNKNEIAPDALEVFRLGVFVAKNETHVALPGTVESYDVDAQTVVVQAGIKATLRAEDGTLSTVALPLLVDCPVQFPAGGGATMTFPVTKGDECLVVFADGAIDAWWQSGGVGEKVSVRMHDLSDGFALLGFRSKPRVLANVSTTSAQLRSDDGSTFVDLNPAGQVVKVKAPGGITLDAPTVTMTGAIAVLNEDGARTACSINGATQFAGEVFANGKRVDDTHTHPDAQGGNTGPVN
ncbi:Gp138 family membrane-puncturing spike protein [Burkholderia sp. NRF60-BP8]|uniref:Gp138 family membrane-puncturing spike protein n=1 Tax=Burkholderia sp. NRF60-BP8 TaxID=1637853 RepID=UPI0007586AE3|nr:Gp138 family membrane-puncturing spike protein [Burkholderia sp. NRF60-BP8]AOI78023.1 hypothetical protein WS54_16900 [Burkholderia sp. NRF60-BP8]KVA18052.1 hypothetical protein WS54_05575 [Burkholderia sp. NRF60-BP8]